MSVHAIHRLDVEHAMSSSSARQADYPATPDPYPSRIDYTPRVIPREEPVVWGERSGSGGPLGWRDLAFFDRNGYLFYQDLFTVDEMELFKRELRRLKDAPEMRDEPQTILELDGKSVRSIFEPQEFSTVFERLSRDPRLRAAAEQILGSQVYLHQSRVNFKPGFEGKEFYWHSDYETWHVEDGMPRMRAVSCSILLAPNDEFNGALMVIPGSQRDFIVCTGATPKDNYKQSLRKQETGVPDKRNLAWLVDKYGLKMPKGPEGSVLFFDCNLMHGSASNISPWPRSNVFFVYNSVENALVDPYCGLDPRPPYIANRDSLPLEPLVV